MEWGRYQIRESYTLKESLEKMEQTNIKFAHSITPRAKLVDLRIEEIWRYRDLLMLFVHRDFVAYYKQTILGPLWFVIQPLLTTLVFTVIFGNLAKISTDELPPILFYLAGVTAWNYFAECFKKTSNSFKANAVIFGKVYFPRILVPLSITITNLIAFGIQFVLFLGFLLYFMLTNAQIEPNAHMALFPLLILLMGMQGLGFGLLVSALTTKYRDLQFLVAFGIQLLMYATPVIYPASSISEKYRWVLEANPMTAVIETFRFGFLGSGTFSWLGLGYTTLCTLIITILGIIVFNRTEKSFMDTV
jgi:lipopolysaccharide transport system permease protein